MRHWQRRRSRQPVGLPGFPVRVGVFLPRSGLLREDTSPGRVGGGRRLEGLQARGFLQTSEKEKNKEQQSLSSWSLDHENPPFPSQTAVEFSSSEERKPAAQF